MTTRKTRIIAAFAMLFAVALVGCSKNYTPDELAIRLSVEKTTESTVNDSDAFTAAIAGWESSVAVNYGIKSTWHTTASIKASDTASDVILADNQYYNHNSAVKSYIKAWHPAGSLADNGIVTFGGAADGSVDVLLSEEISGSAKDNSNKQLIFNHPLTQIKFTVIGDASFDKTTVVNSITIKNAGVPIAVDLKTDILSYTTMNLDILGINGIQSITETETPIGQPIMIRPITGQIFSIDIKTTNTNYNDVAINVNDTDLKKGKAYTITLFFTGGGLTTQAKTTAWDDTGVGSGDIVID